jgi:hypothetical protein
MTRTSCDHCVGPQTASTPEDAEMTVTPRVRHLRAADLLAPGADRPTDVAELLPSVLIAFTRQSSVPWVTPHGRENLPR